MVYFHAILSHVTLPIKVNQDMVYPKESSLRTFYRDSQSTMNSVNCNATQAIHSTWKSVRQHDERKVLNFLGLVALEHGDWVYEEVDIQSTISAHRPQGLTGAG